MLRTPLKNSKNVNKPFKSPFDDRKGSSAEKKLKSQDDKLDSPLVSRNAEIKRLPESEVDEKVAKKPRLTKCDGERFQSEETERFTRRDLLLLKKKVFEVRQELDSLKSRERCTKKNNPEELKKSICRWRTACQNALEIFCSELKEQKGESCKMVDILQMLGIPESLVNYSEKDDSFS